MKTIFRSACKSHFVQLPNQMLRDNSISLRARGLLAMVLTYQEDWVITKAWIEEKVPEGKQAVSSTFRELEAAGYAVMTEQRDVETGKITSKTWTFHDSPVPEWGRSTATSRLGDRKTECGNPPSGNPECGNPECGKAATKNTMGDEHHVKEDDSKTIKAPSRSKQPTDPSVLQACQEIYEAYPRKSARPVAMASIQKAKLANPQIDLLAAVKKYAQWSRDEKVEPRFIPMPATWFNQERWLDDLVSHSPQASSAASLNRDIELVRNSHAFPGGCRWFDGCSQADKDAYTQARARIVAIDPHFNFQELKR